MAPNPRGTIRFTRLDTNETRDYPGDTSFEPYRREAFRRRTIASQRESVDLTNIPGEGTLATEGVWRREMVEWSHGMGQFSLDRKTDDDPRRYLASVGVDIFNLPQRATLLPAVQEVFYGGGTSSALLVFCNNLWVLAKPGSATVDILIPGYNPSSPAFSASGTFAWDPSYTTPTNIYSICANATSVYVATDQGIYVGTPTSTGGATLLRFASNDDLGYHYNMVRWANDQLIAGAGPRLYAFQPRGGSGEAPLGVPPSSINPDFTGSSITDITNGYPTGAGTSALVTTNRPHGLVAGQFISISGSIGRAYATATPSLSGGTLTCITTNPHGFVVGQQISFTHYFSNGAIRTEVCPIVSVISDVEFTYQTTKVGSAILGVGYVGGTFVTTGDTTGYGYNNSWTVASVGSSTTFTITALASNYGALSLAGSISDPLQNGTYQPDALVTVQDPSWIWSDATGGQTQVYFAGYSAPSGAPPKNGGIYRSDLLGSSTSSSDGIQTVASASVAQPWMLDTPVQCLPMSPDEYPTCVEAVLNYIFVGTNRGIRMCQTLSIYDPTATATGDLKSGPVIPNILTPMTSPVSRIVGDGRFVWFIWSDYKLNGSTYTGLGKLDLTTFIPGDDLAPVYATDLMLPGGSIVNDLCWDPVNNVPVFVIEEAIFGPEATNIGGVITPYAFVDSGVIVSSYFDYGIAEPKIPIFFDYGAWLVSGTSVSAEVIMDPLAVSPQTITVPTYTASDSLADNEYTIVQSGSYPNDRGRQFQVAITLTGDGAAAPVLNRWTLKAWATPVQGTEISAVLNVMSKTTGNNGVKEGFDPEIEWFWFEEIRWNSILVTYTDGQSSVLAVIDSIDDIPHKAKGDFKGGFEGDFVVDLKTLGAWTFTPAATS